MINNVGLRKFVNTGYSNNSLFTFIYFDDETRGLKWRVYNCNQDLNTTWKNSQIQHHLLKCVSR